MKGSQSYPGGLGVHSGLLMSNYLPIELPEATEEFELVESDASSGNASDVECLQDCIQEATDQ